MKKEIAAVEAFRAARGSAPSSPITFSLLLEMLAFFGSMIEQEGKLERSEPAPETPPESAPDGSASTPPADAGAPSST